MIKYKKPAFRCYDIIENTTLRRQPACIVNSSSIKLHGSLYSPETDKDYSSTV